MRYLYALGIDFGTSNSCVCQASYYRRLDGTLAPQPVKRPTPVSIQSGETVPTAIFLGSAEEPPEFGRLAEERAVYYPGKSSFYPTRFKNQFKLGLGMPGEAGVEAFLNTREFLRFLKAELESVVPFHESSDKAEFATFIGHPVQWNAEQRRLTVQAARDAGFPNVSLDAETSAALYTHLCEQQLILPPDQNSRLLVVDMGGGTTDFALIDVPADLKEAPISTPVDPYRLVRPWGGEQTTYGGRDIDLLLLSHIGNKLGYTSSSRHWAFLLREMRRFKEQFSLAISRGRDEYQADWVIEDRTHEVRLTRSDFETLARPYIDQLPQLLVAALSLEKLRSDQIDGIILTGGSSRWYWVEPALAAIFPHLSLEAGTIARHRDPEQSVARGLAYSCMIDAMGERPRPRRRAAHAIWLACPQPTTETPLPAAVASPALSDSLLAPPGSSVDPHEETAAGHELAASPSPNGADPINSPDSGDSAWHPQFGPETLVTVMDRGQLLPFTTSEPTSLAIEQVDFNARQASLALKLYTGSAENAREELYNFDRVARFNRPLWEGLLKRIARRLPWSTPFDRDRFNVEMLCSVDENELFLGRITITRYLRGRPAQEIVQILEMKADA